MESGLICKENLNPKPSNETKVVLHIPIKDQITNEQMLSVVQLADHLTLCALHYIDTQDNKLK